MSVTSQLLGPDATARSATALSDSVPVGGFDIAKLYDVSGWICIVTGGATGLGLVTARALAENGAKVYITGRREEQLSAAAKAVNEKLAGKGSVVPVQADMASKEGITKLRDIVAKSEKYVNLLVNNHGVSMGKPSIAEVEQTPAAIAKEMFENESFERWVDTYTINTASYYFSTFAFLPLLCAAKATGEAGNVILVSSMSGLTHTSQRGGFNYNASKAATISLSNQLATEFARRDLGVRVNAICPGYFASGMSVIDPQDTSKSPEHYRRAWAIPAARTGNAIDYAQCVIATAKNQYQTGDRIIIDGGWLLDTAELSF